MMKVLVPVDASSNTENALRHIVNEFMQNSSMQIHLLHVRMSLPRYVTRFLAKRARDSFYAEMAEKALAPAKQCLERHGIPYSAEVRSGERASAIVEAATRLQCDRIVMGTARKNSLTRMLEDSTTIKVLERTTVPVEVIAGDSISRLERYGLPAGVGGAIALLVAAAAD